MSIPPSAFGQRLARRGDPFSRRGRRQLSQREAADRAAGRFLRECGFTHDNVSAALGGAMPCAVEPLDWPLFEPALAEGSALDRLIAVFLFERAVHAGREPGWNALREARLVRTIGRATVARVRVVPFDGLLLLTDRIGAKLARDHVFGVEPSTITLRNLTPRWSDGAVLDIGTGGGVHALLASRRGATAVGTDISARALSAARRNAAVNGVDQVQWRCGRALEPVAGQRFDLVLGNLPFVLAVAGETYFEHGDVQGPSDAITREVLEHIDDHLSEGGVAILLGAWSVESGQAWAARPLRWVAGSRCDVVILRHGWTSSPEYVAGRLRELRVKDPENYASTLLASVRAFRAAGIDGVAWGALLLRRRASVRDHAHLCFEDAALPGLGGGARVLELLGNAGAARRHADQLLSNEGLQLRDSVQCYPLPYPATAGGPAQYVLVDREGAGARVAIGSATLDVLSGRAASRAALLDRLDTRQRDAVVGEVHHVVAAGLATSGRAHPPPSPTRGSRLA
jgi:methylase of polypeptide subunit release factors